MGFTTKGLEPVMVVISYLPTFYGIMFLASADDNDEYGDRKGISGLLAGVLSLGYAAVSGKQVLADVSGDFCRVAAGLRLILGVIAFFAGVIIAAAGGEDAAVFVLLYLGVGLLSLVEAPLLYIYALTLRAPLPPPPQPPQQPQPRHHPPPLPQAPAHHCHDSQPLNQYVVQPAHVPVQMGCQSVGGARFTSSMGLSSMTPAMMVPRDTVFFSGPVESHPVMGLGGQAQAHSAEMLLSRPAPSPQVGPSVPVENPMAVPLTGEPVQKAPGPGGPYF